MESILWNLEDKWKLSTQKAIALFASASFLVIGICVVTIFKIRKSRRKGIVHQEPESTVGCRSVKKVLMRSVRWSGPGKWEEGLSAGSEREMPSPLLVRREAVGLGEADQVGWQSHNSSSGVWQRPILMGEKCELPRFSGLILYDQKGKPLLDHCEEDGITIETQEKTDEVVRTTLRDLL